ncbi:MAG: penicillin-binding protein [Solirubrobacteraceae bacterium]|nr:penicillin-binding protein [Solirubrobacteraceae bacterium]
MSVAEPPSITTLPLPDPPRGRPKLKKLRLLFLVVGLGTLALVSTVFGMMMAVASDLGNLESDTRFNKAQNSVLTDVYGHPIGVLVDNKNLVYVDYSHIAPVMRQAIIAIEDRRFFTNSGIDIRGIGRAFVNDVFGGGGTQGGSTITQQFVKNAENQQDNRTIFEKLREAAMAYHLTRKWSKEKILTEYLNTIYFGNGAYGIESAARIYFGDVHVGCGTHGHPNCASQLQPAEAALLAGMVANPSGYDPQTRWKYAMARRNLVLKDMLDQGYLNRSAFDSAVTGNTAPPIIKPPTETVRVPDPLAPTDPTRRLNVGYFNNWVRQQLVDRYGAGRAFRAGWSVRTTLDIDMQSAAEQAIRAYLPNSYLPTPIGPSASLVAIDNKTGEVRAMVGGPDDINKPFNLATQGQRQPGSAFKPFVLAAAIRHGISPASTYSSKRKIFDVPGTHGKEKFVVNNYEGNYSGISTLARATTFSDNSVYAEVGFKTGFRRIARMARAMGIRTPVSHNPAISLGGLKQGVTVLDMAHAYETFAENGQRVEGTLGAADGGPVGIRRIVKGKKTIHENKTQYKEVFTKPLADAVTPILQSVVSVGTGTKAQYGGFAAGKTGTTENYGDAWFVGWTDKYTVAVWVGYPDSVKSMKTDYGGTPVAGGTFPAAIWRAFIVAATQIDAQHAADRAAQNGQPAPATTIPIPAPASTTPSSTTPSTTTPTTAAGSGGAGTPPPTTTPSTPPPTSTTPGGTGGATPGGTGGAAPPAGGTNTTP